MITRAPCSAGSAARKRRQPVPRVSCAAKQKVHTRENSARQNGNALDVVVTHYAMTFVSEVLKAIAFRLLSADPPRSDG